MRYFFSLILFFLLLTSPCSAAHPIEMEELLDRLAALNLNQNGYTLGRVLTDVQMKTALQYPLKVENPEIYKFQDGDLYIVAEKITDRVIILYKQYDPASRKKIQEVVGALFLDFGDPTIFVHDKIIYWAFGPKGKISEQEYNKIKEEKGKLDILATLKLTSSLEIMKKIGDMDIGNVYYILSSPPVLGIINQAR
ncbi:MAG: hypothetical protein ABFS43_04195 [Thermodesulfobacteriota bacterium]